MNTVVLRRFREGDEFAVLAVAQLILALMNYFISKKINKSEFDRE